MNSNERAFQALLEYEKNCKAKYDYPDHRPSRPIPRGEWMIDFAVKHGTTIKEMKKYESEVDKILNN